MSCNPIYAGKKYNKINEIRKVISSNYNEVDFMPFDDTDISELSLSAFSLSKNIEAENDVVSSLMTTMLNKMDILRAKGQLASITKLLNEVKQIALDNQKVFEQHSDPDNFDKEKSVKAGASSNPKTNAKVASVYKRVYDNFELQLNPDGTTEFIGYRNKLKYNYEQLSYNSVHLISEEEADANTDENGDVFIEGKNYKTDPEKSVSGQVKRLLSEIPLEVNGKKKLTPLFTYKKVEFGKVFNYLLENLSNLPIDEIIPELEDLSGSNYIAKGVLNKINELKKTNPEIVNGMLSVLRKQKAQFISMVFTERKPRLNKDGSQKVHSLTGEPLFSPIMAKAIEANRTGAKDIIFANWNEINKNQVDSLTKDEKSSILSDFTKQISKEFPDENSMMDLSETFKAVGIKVSKEALFKLKNDFDNKKNKKHFKKEFQGDYEGLDFQSFLLKKYQYIFTDFANGKDIFETQKGSIKSLAIYEQKFDLDASSQSFRNNNGDTIYSFVNPHHLSNTLDKLDDIKFQEQLMSDTFAKHSTWIGNPNAAKLFYFDSSKNSQKGSLAKEYRDQSKSEKEVTKINLWANRGANDYGFMFTPSPSDKTTFSMLKLKRVILDLNIFKDEKIILDRESDLFRDLKNLLVNSEIQRINEVVMAVNEAKSSGDFSKLTPNYHYTKDKAGRVYYGSGAYFYFIPELNNLMPRSSKNGFENTIMVGKDYDVIAGNTMIDFLSSEIKSKIDKWKNIDLQNKIDGAYLKNMEGSIQNIATDFVINSVISYANQYMTITGDPALFGKGKFDNDFKNYIPLIEKTKTNLFKRAAKDIAPGTEGNFKDKSYSIVFIEEPKGSSELAKKEDGTYDENSPYYNTNIADAQEWTTVQERLKVMLAYGKIKESDYDAILEKIDNGEDLNLAELNIIMQPDKPVQVLNQLNEKGGYMSTYYIKSSSFPLIPQLTKQFPNLEKMRLFMEDKKIDRVVTGTAAKLGYQNPVKLFNENGVFNDEHNYNEDVNRFVLDRSGFRIQQEVPYDENKKSILEGSQIRKGIFGNILPEWKFFNGKKSGNDLKREVDNIHGQIYRKKLESLKKKIKFNDKTGEIKNFEEIKDLMVEEGIDRGYSVNDILSMGIERSRNGRNRFKIPIFFHPMVHKVESLLNSIIKNKVLKTKLPGKSYVQGSAMGFNSEDWLKSVGGYKGVIFTKDYRGKLDYHTDENGELFAEVLLPSYFNGVDLSKYIKSNRLLDTSKIDPELLTAIGYRIPTQGHNSMIRLKVVGLLPKESGDLIIVPGAMAIQMGSDFDVDKLYVHRYNFKEENGRIIKPKFKKYFDEIDSVEKQAALIDEAKKRGFNSIEEATENGYKMSDIIDSINNDNQQDEELENRLIEIYHEILKHPEIQKASIIPLDNNFISDLKTELTEGLDSGKSKSVLSDDLHSDMIETQAAGKIGIAVASTWVTGQALQQYAGTYIRSFKDPITKKYRNLSVMFSETNDPKNIDKFNDENGVSKIKDSKNKYVPNGNTSNPVVEYGSHPFKGAWRLDKINGFLGRKITDVLVNIQTEAVDNANNQRLYYMNLNKHTFDVAMLIGSAGHDEKMIGYFLNQPAVKDYLSRLNNLDDYTKSEFIPDKKDSLRKNMLLEYGIAQKLRELTPSNISLSDMKQEINTDAYKTELQKKVLSNFFIYEDLASSIKGVRNALNIDTKDLGSSFTGVVNKVNSFGNKILRSVVGNADSLYQGTTSGHAVDYGLFGSVKMFGAKNMLPYDSEVYTKLSNKIARITNKDISEKDAEKIATEIRSALYNEVIKSHFDISNINELRTELTIGKNNLAKRLIDFKEVSDNYFIQSLQAKLPDSDNPIASIEHYSAKDARIEHDYKKTMAWLELLNSPKDSMEYKMGRDLFLYSTIFGTERTARDYGRYTPTDYLIDSGLYKALQESADFTNGDNANIIKLQENFIMQYFQHNPAKLLEKQIAETLDKARPEFTKEFDEKNRTINVYALTEKGYVKIDKLGAEFKTEYDLGAGYQKTFNPNNSKGVELKGVTIEPKTTKEEIDPTGIEIFKNYDFFNGLEATLSSISNQNNSEYSMISSFFEANFNLIKDYKLEIYDSQNPNHYGRNGAGHQALGTHNAGAKIIAINPLGIVSEAKFMEAILHEVAHAFTVSAMKNPEMLSKEQRKAYDNIVSLYNELSSRKDLVEKFPNAFKNQVEFVAEALANPAFKKELNSKKVKNKNALKQLIEFVKGLFPGLVEGNALDVALTNIFSIIESSNIQSNKSNISEEFDIKFSDMSNEEIIALNEKLKNSKKDYLLIGEKVFSGNWLRSEILDFELSLRPYTTNEENGEIIFVEYIPTIEFKFIDEGKEYRGTYSLANQNYQFEPSFYKEYEKIKDKFYRAIKSNQKSSVKAIKHYTGNIIPEENTVFVFGSNPEGRHGAGAAKIAKEKFGAIYGQGEGLQGSSYALPTKNIRNITTPKGTINVYWGQSESETSTKILSNLAPRKFTWEGREYDSVEHAYQSNKSGTFDQTTYDAYLKEKVNFETKSLFTVDPIQSIDKKAKSKAKIATQYIGFAENITGSSTALYAKQAGQYANTGNYSANDVIFVSIGGKRGNATLRKQQQDKTIKEAIKALETGATLITDNAAYVESNSYNEGEKRLAANLKAKGYHYSEIIVDGNTLGVWSKKNKIENAYGKKIKGKGNVAEMKAADSLELMKKLVVESFIQNPNSEAAKKLLQYENFTHNTNELIDKAFLEGLKLAQQELNITGEKSIAPERIIESIKKLYETAKQNPNKQFKVAFRNTTEKSLNGYTGLEMIEMFNNAGIIPSNVIFSKEWFDTGRFKGNQVEEMPMPQKGNIRNRTDVFYQNNTNQSIEEHVASENALEENEYIVYHGTSEEFDKFDFDKGSSGFGAQKFGKGVYVTKSKDKADGYRRKANNLKGKKEGGQIKKMKIKMNNPIDAKSELFEELREKYPNDSDLTKALKDLGYDGVVYPQAKKGEDVSSFVIFDESQIEYLPEQDSLHQNPLKKLPFQKISNIAKDDVILQSLQNDIFEIWDVYSEVFGKAGVTKESISAMSIEELNKFIEENIC